MSPLLRSKGMTVFPPEFPENSTCCNKVKDAKGELPPGFVLASVILSSTTLSLTISILFLQVIFCLTCEKSGYFPINSRGRICSGNTGCQQLENIKFKKKQRRLSTPRCVHSLLLLALREGNNMPTMHITTRNYFAALYLSSQTSITATLKLYIPNPKTKN